MQKKSTKSGGGREENKSAAIRDYITSNPGDGPTAVADALNSTHGWKISAAYVSTIKNKMRDVKVGLRRGRSIGGLDEKALLQAKELAKQAGGIGQAKAALDLLDRLTG
jgi:hypothetical protein